MGAKTLNGRYRMERPLAKRADRYAPAGRKKSPLEKRADHRDRYGRYDPLTTDYSIQHSLAVSALRSWV